LIDAGTHRELAGTAVMAGDSSLTGSLEAEGGPNMSDSTTSGTRPERDFEWLSEHLEAVQSVHADFVRLVDRSLSLKRDMLVPYFSLKELVQTVRTAEEKAWRLPIREVRVGPSRNRELNRACAQSLLIDNGYDCPVTASDIPYRS
jgi:hypothetical protein